MIEAMDHRIAFGKWGEAYAAEFLHKQGYSILARNYRTPYGEIDLVAQQHERLVFVEVKTRSSSAFGYPEEAITPQKRQHLYDAAILYVQEHHWEKDWQIDVVAILRTDANAQPQLVHFENI